jgi:tetraacyldisaccharide 4'-kinase
VQACSKSLLPRSPRPINNRDLALSLSGRLQQAWYQTESRHWLSWLLLDASWLYRALISLRHKLYSSGVLQSEQLSVPVIVVGNVIAGGAGKTPIVMAIAQHLQQQGWQPGILSRGYGRQSSGVLEVQLGAPAHITGDEPALIKSALKIPVFVAEQRVDAALALLEKYPSTNVLICDDGLQHLPLKRDIEICVFDERGIGNGLLLPAGPLREPWPRPVDFILHRGGMPGGFVVKRHLAQHALLADGSSIALKSLADQPLHAVAGIADPEAFFRMLRAQGLHLQSSLALPDHYHFNSWKPIFHRGDTLICTEKDALKLWATPWAQELRILAVPLQIELPPGFYTALLGQLSQCTPMKSARS